MTSVSSAISTRPLDIVARNARGAWLHRYRDWIACRLPHFTVRGDAVYFLASRRPLLRATRALSEAFERINGTATIKELVDEGASLDGLAALWEAGIVQVVPPETIGRQTAIIVIEPHPDDAALSVGGALLRQRDNSAKAIVAVCSRSNSTSYMALSRHYGDERLVTALREKESLLAARFLNARYVGLGEPDISLRYLTDDDYTPPRMRGTMFRAGAHRRMPPPDTVVEETAGRLWNYLRTTEFDELWIPLGAGNHFDHRLTRDACLRVIGAHRDVFRDKRTLLYEDLPYVLENPESVEQLVHRLREAGATLEKMPVDITSVFEEKMECLRMYASQWKVSALRPHIEAAARRASLDGGYGESFWRLSTPPAAPLAPLLTAAGMPAPQLDDTLAALYRRRRAIRRLGVLIAHAVAMWREDAELLLRVFPNARVDVLALDENRPEMSSVEAERLRVTYFGRSPLRWWWPAVRWACHVNQTALIFGGSRRVSEANWVRRILPARQAHAFEHLGDVCSLWRWWLTRETEEHRGRP